MLFCVVSAFLEISEKYVGDLFSSKSKTEILCTTLLCNDKPHVEEKSTRDAKKTAYMCSMTGKLCN